MDLVKNNEMYALSKGFGVKEFGEALEKVMGREPAFVQKTSFAPSGLSYQGQCPRRWYYAFNGAEFVYNATGPAVANMDAGSDSGERLANLFDKAGILVAAEEEAKLEDPPVRGFIDAIINWKGQEVIVEVKTTKNEAWHSRSQANKVPSYQLLQLLIYMHIKNNSRGLLVTENKNTHELFLLPVRMNAENRAFLDRVFEWMRMVYDNAQGGDLPVRPFTKSSFQCKGCEVKNTCWDGYVRGSVNGKDPNPGVVDLPPLQLPK